jgi:D-aminopeptidase
MMAEPSLLAKMDEAKVDAIFAALDQGHQPGVAVAIAIAGVPVYRKGFGLAHMELPVVLSTGMRMRIGSTTKHFVALTYMLLCEEGRAGIDDPIGKHVPGLHAASRDVTMRQLMGHVSGIRDILAISMHLQGHDTPASDAEMIDLYRSIDDVDFAPGTNWSYNNGGYMLLTAAIEAITGQPLDTVLQERIFTPLGMRDTLLRRWDTDFVPNSATLHFRRADGRFTRDYMTMEVSGAGGIVSTMDDMLIWMKHMDTPTIGSAETWRVMREPMTLANGTSTGYGLGLVTMPYRGLETLSHGGGVLAGNSQMIKVPAAKLDISIASNRADVSAADLANRIIDACVEGLPSPVSGSFERRTGVYLSPASGRVAELNEMGDMQLVALDGGPPVPMHADAQGVLQLPDIMQFLQQQLTVQDEGLRLVEFGQELAFQPVERDATARLGDRSGSYRSTMAGLALAIEERDEGAVMTTRGAQGSTRYKLEPITTQVWKATTLGPLGVIGAVVTFAADGAGLELTAGRMPALRFERTAGATA